MNVFEQTMTKVLRGIDAADQILELGAVHVRHEVRRDVPAPLVPERVAHQERPQIRAADADIHDVFEFFAGDPSFLSERTAAAKSTSFLRESRTSA